MNFRILLFIGFFTSVSFAQEDIKRNLYYGNEAYNSGNYEDALDYYQDAVDQSPLNFKANYNLANAYYRMNKFDKAMERMNTVVNLAPTSFDKAKAYHNIGNAHMMKQDWDGAIEAYKSALRLNPSDEETRYNLAYAQQMKRKQDEQKRQNESGNSENDAGSSNEENEGDSQENDSDQNENSDNNENQNENENENENQDEGEQSDEQDPKDGQGQKYNAKLSKEQINQMLKEYYQREKELMKKLNENKKGGYGPPRKKDW